MFNKTKWLDYDCIFTTIKHITFPFNEHRRSKNLAALSDLLFALHLFRIILAPLLLLKFPILVMDGLPSQPIFSHDFPSATPKVEY